VTRSARARGIRALLLAAALVPPIALAVQVLPHSPEVPHHDQWGFAALVLKGDAGQLEWKDLWLQNNEHRPVVPYVLLLGLARLTAWNLRAELVLSFACALLGFALLADLLRRTVGRRAPSALPGLVLFASLVFFSMAQQENWASGWQLTVTLNVLAAIAVAWSLECFGATPRGAAAMLCAAAIGAFSFASGLLLLGLVPLALLVAPPGDRRGARLALVATAALVAALLVRLYFVGYYTPLGPAPVSPLALPRAFEQFAFAYVGASFAGQEVDVAQAWGVAGSCVLLASAAWLWSRSPSARRALLPWLLLAAYALASGLSTASGRLFGGALENAVISRYVPISALFWPAVAAAAALALAELRASGWRRAWLAGSAVAGVALVAAALAYTGSYLEGADVYLDHTSQYAIAAQCVLDPESASDDCLSIVCWDPSLARTTATKLQRRHLGPFASPAPRASP
jgi:hypothetical protein